MVSVLLLGLLTACERPKQDDTSDYPAGEGSEGPHDGADTLSDRDRPQAFMAAPASPNVTSLAAAAQSYSADTSLYRVKYALNKAVRTGDTVYLRLRRDSASGITPLNLLRKSVRQRDSADYKVDKIFGKQANYRAILQYRRAGQVIVSKTVTWQTNFAPAVDTTPPEVDTLIVDSTLAIMKLDIKPDSVSVLTSHDSLGNLRPLAERSQQFCPLVVFADGKVALPSEYKALEPCAIEYAKVPLTIRSVTVKQQARADSLCIKWEATGGTITASQCGVPA